MDEYDPNILQKLDEKWVWTSHWLDVPTEPEDAGHLVRFIRTIHDYKPRKVLQNSHSSVLIRISADTRYKLLVNGRRVCVGPARGFSRMWFYDTVDVAPFLKAGTNVFEIIVLRLYPASEAAFQFPRTQSPGLTVYGLVGDEYISSGGDEETDWRCQIQRHVKYPTSMAWGSINTYEESGSPADDPSEPWHKPVEQKQARFLGALSTWELRPRMIPLPEETPCRIKAIRESKGGVDVKEWKNFTMGGGQLTLEPHTKHRVEVEFEVHSTAYVHMAMDRQEAGGSKISFTYSEAYERPSGRPDGLPKKDDRTMKEGHVLVGPCDTYVTRGGKGSNAEYIGGDVEVCEPFMWKTFRFIVLEIEVKDEPLTLRNLELTQTNYPMAVKASVEAPSDSGEDVSKMLDVSVRTMRNCMFDAYYDCPFYEQLQYGEDSRSAMMFHYLLSGDDRLARQAITTFAASQLPDGLLLARFPDHVEQVIPGFSLFWIMAVCDHMLYFGDKSFVSRFFPTIDGVFSFFERHLDDRTGLVSSLPPKYWNFIDWNVTWPEGRPEEGEPLETWSFVTMLYAYTLRRAATLLQHVGRKGLVEEYGERADRASESVRQHCYNGEFFTDSLTSVHRKSTPYSQVAQIWGVLSLATKSPEEIQRVMKAAIDPNKGFAVCSYVMVHYLFRALDVAGLYDQAYHTMWEPWRVMLAKNLTTWEEDNVNSRSDCHEWSCIPVYELLSEVAGLTPVEPSWNVVQFSPRLSLYKDFKAEVCLGRQGVAEVMWQSSGDKQALVSLRLPKPMRVVTPDPSGKMVDRGIVKVLKYNMDF